MTSDQIFKTLGNKICLRVLALLAIRALRVGELSEITKIPMVMISKNLMRLRAKKLVSAKRAGVSITYSLADTPEAVLIRALLNVAKSTFPKEALLDEKKLQNFVFEEPPARAGTPESNFTGIKITQRRHAKSPAFYSAGTPANAHIGELPTNLL